MGGSDPTIMVIVQLPRFVPIHRSCERDASSSRIEEILKTFPIKLKGNLITRLKEEG